MAITKPGTASWPNLVAQWRLSGLTQAEFCSRRGISLPTFRILHCDRDGYVVWAKRLEAGTFRRLDATGPQLEVRHAELAMLLGGIDPAGSRYRVRFSLPRAAPAST
jgi:hypothetical protein